MESLAIDPVDPSRLFLGTGYFRAPIIVLPPIEIPATVHRTTDAGATWATATLPVAHVQALAVDPTDHLTVYAGTDSGVWKSVDGGATFPQRGTGIPFGQPVIGLAVDSSNPSRVYAVAVEIHSGTPAGIFKSFDGGATWVPRNAGLTSLYVRSIALDPTSPSVLYAAVDRRGIFRSVNGAASWSAVNEGLADVRTLTVAVDPTAPGRVYAGTVWSSVFVRDFLSPCPAGSDGDPCDDGDPCTVGDACSAGVCQGATPLCGDGAVAGCEQCDAGAVNGTPGSCCSTACAAEPAGMPCADDGNLCTHDACNAAGSCRHTPEPDPQCVESGPRGAALKIVNKPGTGVDQVKFKWAKGPAVTKPALGAPNDTTAYALCVYDGTASGTVLAYRGRPLPPCKSSPCWVERATGWKFKSPGGADGVTGVDLKSDVAGKARLQLTTKAPSLALPTFPLTKSPSVVAELRTSDGACWGATFSSALRSDAERFTAKSD
jgi:hypothetical protein